MLNTHLPVNQIFLKRLMYEWWDRQPEAGPKELPTSDRNVLEVPNLRLCVWRNDVPIIAEALKQKFPVDSDASAKWEAVMKAHADRFGQGQTTQCATSDVVVMASTPRHLTSSGPDFSVDPKPCNLTDEAPIEVPFTEKSATEYFRRGSRVSTSI